MNAAAKKRAAAEYERHGAVRSVEFLFDAEEHNPTNYPDHVFDFRALVDDPTAMFDAGKAAGTEIAVIGAGNAGCAAAWLLMRFGFKPVLYEITNRVGGRSFTRPFGRDPRAVAELGSMRIPLAQKLVFHLLDRWGIPYHRFQNPLVVDTWIDVGGEQVFYSEKAGKFTRGPKKLIAAIDNVKDKYNRLIDPIVKRWDETEGHLEERKRVWRSFVDEYNNKSLFQVLVEHGWNPPEITLFGNIGIGSGGFDAFFTASFLEIVRIEIQRLEARGTQQLIVGGTNQIPLRFWSERVECRHWGTTSVEDLNDGAPRPGVRSIRTPAPGKRGPIEIVDVRGNRAEYPAAILSASPRAVDTTIDINLDAFSDKVWTALRAIDVTSSEKVFVLTRTAFWNEDPKFRLHTTLTDQPPRQMYTFDARDFGQDTKAGAICLSYSWANSSIKFNALDDEQRVRLCLDAIENMACYGPEMRRRVEEEMLEILSICWEDQYGYSGGYRMAYPGQAQQVSDLHAQSLGYPRQWNNGLYLAGEALSWYGLSGWIDGAIKTGLTAALSVVRHLS
jgi:monoamine oxidase